MFITISREYGAGGSTVASRVAESLGWRLLDNQVVQEVAARAGLPVGDVAVREERGPSFVERLARALVASNPEVLGPESMAVPEADESHLMRLTEQVVAEATHEGNAVLVGRAAVAVLGQRSDALHVRLVAPAAHRAMVISERLGIDADAAAREIKEVDGYRARYHKQWYDREWTDPRNYHLTLNTEWLGIDRSAEIIVGAIARKPTP
jgi:cytidylate kinase